MDEQDERAQVYAIEKKRQGGYDKFQICRTLGKQKMRKDFPFRISLVPPARLELAHMV